MSELCTQFKQFHVKNALESWNINTPHVDTSLWNEDKKYFETETR
jgi:hypothetical protein